MPISYNQPWSGKPKPMPRRRFTSKKRSAKPRSKVDKSLSRRITRIENTRELKYYDSTTTIVPSAAGAALSLVQLIHRGDEYNERAGDNIYTKKVRFSYIITKPEYLTPPAPTYQIRCVLLWDKTNAGGGNFQIFTGVAPIPKEESCSIFDDRDGMTNINAPYNIATKDRFKILYDRIHIIDSATSAASYSRHVRKTIPLSGAKVQYTDAGDAGGIDELPLRNLVFLYFCAGSTETHINFTARVFYNDD